MNVFSPTARMQRYQLSPGKALEYEDKAGGGAAGWGMDGD